MAAHYCCCSASAEKAMEKHIKNLSVSPPRRAVNVLQYFMGTPDIVTNVMH